MSNSPLPPAPLPDAYAECFPSAYDYSGAIGDSDEEGGPEPLDPGAEPGPEAKPARRQQVCAGREAAAQGGAEGGGGRWHTSNSRPPPAAPQNKREAKERNKISTQLGKIQEIFEDKGYTHGTAFARGDAKPGGGAGGGGSAGGGRRERRAAAAEGAAAGGEELELAPAPVKKRRI